MLVLATEFRQFLLYIGPVILKDILPERMYVNFLNFSVTIYVLCSPKFYRHYLNHITYLIRNAVTQFAEIYGSEEVTFDFHALLHICEDVYTHGP